MPDRLKEILKEQKEGDQIPILNIPVKWILLSELMENALLEMTKASKQTISDKKYSRLLQRVSGNRDKLLP